MRLNISINDSLMIFNVTVDYVNNSNKTEHTELSVVDQIHLHGRIISSSVVILTNILVVTTFSVSWRFFRHSTALLLLILACVDIIGNVVSFIYHLIMMQNEITYYDVPPIYFYLNNGFKRLSFLMMIPISANRYALICRPFTHHVITSKKSTLIQITSLSVFALSSGIFELFRRKMLYSIYKWCVVFFDRTLSVALPLLITFVLTVLVIHEFRRMNRTLEDSVRTRADSRQGERNVTRTMIAVNVAFIVLVLPAGILSSICEEFYFCYCSTATPALFLISDINFSINIFIYTLFLPKFRSKFEGYFKWKCCKKRENEPFEVADI